MVKTAMKITDTQLAQDEEPKHLQAEWLRLPVGASPVQAGCVHCWFLVSKIHTLLQ